MGDSSSEWKRWVSDEEAEIIRRGGYGTDSTPGSKPCLLLVDIQRQIVGGRKSTLDQISEFPSGIGERAWAAIDRLEPVLAKARSMTVPVIYTMLGSAAASWDGLGIYGERIARRASRSVSNPIVTQIGPQDSDLVIEKLHASSFSGTPLLSALVCRRIDTVIVAGGSTSGCVRATAVDAASLGFKVVVLSECTFDRITLSHAASLLDIWMKYGAVYSIEEVLDYLETVSAERGEQ